MFYVVCQCVCGCMIVYVCVWVGAYEYVCVFVGGVYVCERNR